MWTIGDFVVDDGDLGGLVRVNGSLYAYDTDPGTGERFAYIGSYSDLAELRSKSDGLIKVWVTGPNKGTAFGGNSVQKAGAVLTSVRVFGIPLAYLLAAGLILAAWRRGMIPGV